MAGKLILMTGATSFVGYPILIEALSKGYKVRVAARSEAKLNTLREAELTKPFLKALGHIFLPNFDQDGAFDEAVKGVDYIIHTA